MDIEQVLYLFDSSWFEREIFKKQQISSSNSQYPEGENQEETSKSSETNFSRAVSSIHTRSMSEDLSSRLLSFNSASQSPESPLFSPKLHTIFSSKDIAGSITESSLSSSAENNPKEKSSSQPPESSPVAVAATGKKNKIGRGRGRGRKRWCESKSLSELEFEEVKGFMDLGFVFSEEDKADSNLTSIIPGLKSRSSEIDEDDQEVKLKGSVEIISRPYLSEAWEALEEEKEEVEQKPFMMNHWRFPVTALTNEIDIKDNLRWWAHTVASTVR